jgi:hypothetical protein
MLFTRRRLFSAILLGLALFGAAAFVRWGDWIACKVHAEVFKVLAQLVLLAGLGGIGSLVVDELNRAGEHREQNRDRLRRTLSDIIKSYNTVKALRRRLRAEAVRPNPNDHGAVVYGEDYATLLRSLNDEQLNIEAHVRLIDGNRGLYPNSEFLMNELQTAEGYLGKLVTEWEDNLGAFTGQPSQRPLAILPRLRCFLGDPEMDFGPGFSGPISNVLVELSKAIAK